MEILILINAFELIRVKESVEEEDEEERGLAKGHIPNKRKDTI